MKKIGLIPNILRDVGLLETKKLLTHLQQRPFQVFMEERFQQESMTGVLFLPIDQLLRECDVVVVLGGDGTILQIAPQAAQHQCPILGINLGNLGFLAQAEKGDYRVFDALEQGDYSILSCMMLECAIIKDGKEIQRYLALNDIAATGDGKTRMVTVSASVNGTCIGTYAADGLIVATAVGSTAYSLSAGGAILHPQLEAMILTPICPHTLKARSMVVSGENKIEIKAELPRRADMAVVVDGKRKHILEADEIIRVTRSAYRTKLIRTSQSNFFDVLREKLSD